MTLPTVRSFSSGGADNDVTLVVSKPTGLVVGDLMLAFQESDADGALVSMTAPSGFTEIASQAPNAGTNVPAVKVWRKVATSTETAASTFTFPDADGANSSVALLAITTGTFDSTNLTNTPTFTTQGDAVGASLNAPSITSGVVVDALLLCAFMPDTGGPLRNFTTPIPSGMTLVVESTAGSAAWTRVGVYSQALTSTANTGVKTATLSASPNGWVGASMLVLPASVTGPEGGRAMFAGA